MSSDALAVREYDTSLALAPVMNLQIAKQRLAEFQAFVKDYLQEGEDFGKIPGTPKPTLYKPGADKLCELYGLADDYEIVSKVEDFDRGLFDYTIKCVLTSKRNGGLVAAGMGSCNSFEGKYRWRESQRKCPNCQKETIIKGKQEYGGGWLCFAKKGGCGAKWKDGAKEIESQVVGRIENDDIATLKNTILKMAKKRAKVDATLAATRSSGIFTQDIEDIGLGNPTMEQMKTGAEQYERDYAQEHPQPSAATIDVIDAPPQQHGEVAFIDDTSRKSLYALMSKNKKSSDELKNHLWVKHGVDSVFKIPANIYGDVCQWAKGA